MEQKRKTAEDFAKEQKEISVSEFFEKNKHLLGFDNPTKALLIVVKEAMDNSLDAAEEAGIMPVVKVGIRALKEDVYRVVIEDNGPGIVKEQIPRVFGKLLYGSKFHRLKQNRGQQGIGISAAVLYSQLTTGKPTIIYSKIESKNKTHVYHLHINTAKNEPEIVHEEDIENTSSSIKEHGVRIEMDVVGRYRKVQSVDDYIKQTAMANPFARIEYKSPDEPKIVYAKVIDRLPKQAKAMRPHPYGVELGILLRMLGSTKAKTLQAFLQNEFSSTGSITSREICKVAKLDPSLKPKNIDRESADQLLRSMQKVKINRPPLDCLSPIGEDALKEGLKKLFPTAEFIAAESRPPSVYRGNPFIIETAIVYDPQSLEAENPIKLIRLANKVPLLFQAGAGAIYGAVVSTKWRRYGLQQSGKTMPIGPAVVFVHMCSAWVPFISESKEAIAPYPDIVKEMKLAVQYIARQLSVYIHRKYRAKQETKRLHIFEDYLPLIEENARELAETKNKLDIKQIMDKVVKKQLIETNKENDEIDKKEKTKDKKAKDVWMESD